MSSSKWSNDKMEAWAVPAVKLIKKEIFLLLHARPPSRHSRAYVCAHKSLRNYRRFSLKAPAFPFELNCEERHISCCYVFVLLLCFVCCLAVPIACRCVPFFLRFKLIASLASPFRPIDDFDIGNMYVNEMPLIR